MIARTCLQKRKTGNYYFRKRVPDDLRHILSKNEVVKSLKTNSKSQATRSILQLESYIDECFNRLRRGEAISISLMESCMVTSSGELILGKEEPSSITLSNILQRWIKANRPSDSAIAEWKFAVRQFTELFGDIEITKITTAHLIKYKDVISTLPARYGVKHPALSLNEVSKLYAKEQATETAAITTIAKRISAHILV